MKSFGGPVTEEKFRKSLIIQIWVAVLLLAIGIVTLILANTMNLGEHQQSFLSGLGSGMIAAMVGMIINFYRTLKDPVKFHKFYVKSNDERNLWIQTKALVITSFATLIVAYVVMTLATMGVYTTDLQSAMLIMIATWFVFFLASFAILNKFY